MSKLQRKNKSNGSLWEQVRNSETKGGAFLQQTSEHLDTRIGNFTEQKQKGRHNLDRNGNATITLAPCKYFLYTK